MKNKKGTIEFTMETLASLLLVLIGAAILVAILYGFLYGKKIKPLSGRITDIIDHIFSMRRTIGALKIYIKGCLEKWLL